MSHQKERPPWYAPIIHFATHSVVGTIIFLIVGAPSVLLGWLVHRLRAWHVSELTLTILTFLEVAILLMDSLLFLCFLVFTTWSAVKEFMHETND
ncbi:hypothetical protein APB26_31450 [Pseudomonas aeruginosa]|uniref:hypothetical protein n=1 Tax=Pseudomonas aeruginosa TaxID=287 RepID=UPI00071B86AA|nr:hypothetical protein [Pseudomonas aeruginosa]KSQ21506.1 hypothetical protein APB26_31450 [Pseudomonas aeruginosa]RPV61177.1 hypothetical protein IPC838_17780 [Pseudomonas aeruginosa]